MTIKVKLNWTNASVEATTQRVEADLGEGFVTVGTVAISETHTASTPYEFVYAPAVEATQDIDYRIVSVGTDGEVVGNVITLTVPVEGALRAVEDLAGEVVDEP